MDKEVKNKGYCDSCKRLRILMPPAFKICKTCLRSYKYWEKDHLTKGSKLQEYFNNPFEDPEDITPKQPQKDKEKPEYVKIQEEDPEENKISYRCDYCNKKVNYLQVKCGQCNNILDWRNSPAEKDPNVIICNNCGANLGANARNCKYCGLI